MVTLESVNVTNSSGLMKIAGAIDVLNM